MTSNPFRDQFAIIRNVVSPQFPQWALVALIFFGITRGICVLGCIAIMLIPMFKGAQSRKHHYFLIRRIYPQNARIPYLVPNRCLVLVTCEMVSNAAYLFSVYANYRLYSTDLVLHIGRQQQWYPPHWYALPFIPSYLGIMLSSFGLCHSCLFNVDGKDKSKITKILTPTIYNSIWISWTLITLGSMLYWSICVGKGFFDTQLKLNHVIILLEHAAKSWDRHHDFSRIDLQTMFHERAGILEGLSNTRPNIIGWSVNLIVLASVLLFFYVFVVRLLLRMLKQVLRIRDMSFLAECSNRSSSMWAELEDEFRFLSRSSVVIAVTISVQVLEVIFQIISGEHVNFAKFNSATRLHFRIGSALLSQFPGIFMAPALLLQSWRIFTERSTADESDFHQASSNPVHRSLPVMTSQLLGWNTPSCWSQESEMAVVNFPGLCEIQSTDSGHKIASSEYSDPDKTSKSHIEIMRLTQVTEDVVY